jgi:lipopolysaccharide/colanic/teichoic acid biosynthesis glycosyltransferase/glycosyltransferase involved in cell wall biosynthesis
MEVAGVRKNMKVSVIIPAFNAAGTIQNCLNALKIQQGIDPSDFEVIVVDDGSTDNTAAICKANKSVCLIQQEGPKGASTARNNGIKVAQGSLICFTDADCEPTPTWLSNLIQPFSDLSIAGDKGIYATKQKEWVARFVQLEYEDKYDLLHAQPRIDFIDTYSAGYRRDILVKNNGFDERFHYTEDQELSFRLTARGYQFVFQPEAVVYHHHSDSLYAYFRKKFWIGYWKTQTIRRFPERAVKDSHTPQVMKLQIGLMALLLGVTAVLPVTAVLESPLLPWAALIWFAILAFFILTTLPFVGKAWSKDKAVATMSPLLLAVRALALGFGTVWGVLRPKEGILEEKSGINGLPYLLKRGMDISGSIIGLIFALVLAPFIAAAIKLDSPGPIIFSQQRAGREGKPFTLYKFRSMKVDAEKALNDLIDWNDLKEPQFKLQEDPRLTRVGRFLRRWSLDELPQFWNALKGEMSLVGPRPESLQFVSRYDEQQRRRLMVKPGITGPMQINGRGMLPLTERVQFEVEYIENYSITKDCIILVKTIPAIIMGTGAF